MLLTLLSFILVITAVVLPHELGHYLFALRAGIRPLEFGIGFPPRIAAIKKGETVFSLNAIPIGGFIRVAGMNPEAEGKDEVYPQEESYANKGLIDRALTILGGPLMNFAFAFLVLSLIFGMFGAPTGTSNEIGAIMPGSEAERVGLMEGDKLLELDGVSVKDMEATIGTIHRSAGKELALVIQRGSKVFSVKATPELNAELGVGLIGFVLKPSYKQVGPLDALWLGGGQVVGMVRLILGFLGILITGQASLANIAGPLGIAQISGQAAQGGLVDLLYFSAFLSVNLAILNLLPLPALDGGRILFIIIEAIRRRPLSRDLENKIHYVGIAVLLSLAVLLTINDAIRWFSTR